MPNASEFRRAVSTNEATLVIDAQLRICSANDAAHQLLGYRAGSLRDVSLAWLLPPSRQGLLSELRAAQRNGGRVCVPGALMREDGSLVGVVLTTRACTQEGAPALAVELLPDEDPTLARARGSQTFSLPPPARAISATHPRPGPITTASASATAAAASAQLATCLDLLQWLDTQVLGQAGQDSPKQRALARVVLHRATELLEDCRAALNVHSE